jgi:hypothetical protein
VDWYERLGVWKRATEERLQRRWWLWPALFAADLIWHEICESTNHFLESRGAPIIARMLSIIPSNPAVLAVMTGVLILVTLAVHAYFDTRNVSSIVAQTHAGGLRPQNGLTFQVAHIEPRSTDPTIFYKAKLRAVFKNQSANVIQLLPPNWTTGPDDVPVAFPLGYRYQLEATYGAWRLDQWPGVWTYSLWNKQELLDVRVDPGWSVAFYIALSESVPHADLLARSATQRLGILTIPMKIAGQEHKWESRL